MQLIRVGDKVRMTDEHAQAVGFPATERVLRTVSQVDRTNELVMLEDVGYPVKMERIERVYVTRVADRDVIRTGRGTFEVDGQPFETLVEAVEHVRTVAR